MYAIKLGSEFPQHKLADKGFKEPDNLNCQFKLSFRNLRTVSIASFVVYNFSMMGAI